MSSHRESVVLAVIAVILVSIPGASQSVEISGDEDKTGIIDSKFSDRFKLDFDPGKEILSLVDSSSKLEINKSFKKNVKQLQTAEGFVKIVKTNNSIEKTVQTPYGRFKFGVREGKEYNDFEGENEDKAEDIRDNLMDKIEERRNDAEEKRKVVIQEILPDLEVSGEDNPETEHFNLTNNGDREIDMSAWKVITEGSGTDYLNLTRTISPGETLTYYSGEEESPEINGNMVKVDLTIYSGGKIKVYNSADKVVDSEEY